MITCKVLVDICNHAYVLTVPIYNYGELSRAEHKFVLGGGGESL